MATITDVARQAGVSVSTVSYALSGARPIRPATKARIEAAMAELGYQPNASARSLASRKTSVLAMLYPDADRGVGTTGGEFIHAAAERARELGYHLVLWPIPHDDTRMMSDLVAQGQADGVLMMTVHLDDARADALDAAGVPYAMIGATRDISSRSSVDIDFDATVRKTVDRLTGLGHRQIAFINHSHQSLAAGYGPSVRADLAYHSYLTSLGLTPIARTCDDTPSAGRRVAAEVLDSHPDVTAFMTMNELATFGVYSALQSRGLSIPGDVSIIGLATSMGVSEMSNPPLTTMDVPGTALGRLAVDSLVAQLNGEPPQVANTSIPCIYGEGMSLGPARTTS